MFKKIALLLSLLLIGALVLTACGGDDPTPTPEPEPVEAPAEEPAEEPIEEPAEEPTEEQMEEPTEEPVEEPAEEAAVEPEIFLTVWADDTRTPILHALAEDFEATYGVGLIVEQVMDIDNQIPVAVPAGEGPDIWIVNHDRNPGFVDSGLVAPLDLGDKEADFAQVALDAFTLDGVLYGMPYSVENMALFRNADLVPDAPETWDELLAVGGALQESGDVTYT